MLLTRCSTNLRNSSNKPEHQLSEIATLVGGTIEGNPQTVIRSAAPIQNAGPDDLSFVANSKYLDFIATTKAGALVLAPGIECDHLPVIRHENPYLAFATALDLLYPDEPMIPEGTDASAITSELCEIDPTVRIGPLCIIGRGSRLGANSQLVSSVHIGDDVHIGEGCLLYPGVKIMNGCRIGDRVIIHPGVVIGSDGFGFAESPTGLKKIKQVGWVEIADDVEIGANTTIDRGALGPTRIGRGTKIDNLVQIAHNVEIGENSIIVAQVGISGSTKLGNGAVLGGQVGLVGHIEVGDGVKVGAQSGVSKSVPAGKMMFGSPARDIKETMRIEASLVRLPDLLKRVRKIEKKQDD